MAANDITRRIFNKSFLKNVQSVFSYDSVLWTDELKEKVSEYLADRGFTNSKTGDVPMVQCSKNSIAVMVSEKGVILSMEVADYVSFEHYLEILSDISAVFDIVGCVEIKNFIFQKLNLYRIGVLKDGKKPSKDDTYRILFSADVCKSEQALTDSAPNYFYTIQPGFNEYEDHVVAKLLISSMRVSPIAPKELIEELKQVNERMYSLWHDATTDKVKELMSK